MTTIGIRLGDAVQLIERRGEQLLVYNGLVTGFSMDAKLAGSHGEPAIDASFVAMYAEARYAADGPPARLKVSGAVHVSHIDFVEGRASLGYEELRLQVAVAALIEREERR